MSGNLTTYQESLVPKFRKHTPAKKSELKCYAELDKEFNFDFDRLRKFTPIQQELVKAEYAHPEWPENMFIQLAIMNEEAGEVTKAVLHYHYEGGSIEDVRKELVQTAAMCMRMLEGLKDV